MLSRLKLLHFLFDTFPLDVNLLVFSTTDTIFTPDLEPQSSPNYHANFELGSVVFFSQVIPVSILSFHIPWIEYCLDTANLSRTSSLQASGKLIDWQV
jgi:hypothetical protein